MASKEYEPSQEHLASLGVLLASAAHEIGNPLTTLAGYIDVLLKEVKDTQQIEYLERAKHELSRAQTMVHDLLNYARQDQVVEESIDLQAWLNELIVELNLVSPYENLKFEPVTCEEKFLVCIDSDRFRQVLLNLFLNTLESNGGYAQPRGRHEKPLTITMDIRSDATNKVGLYVEDNGCGVSKKFVENLFEPFASSKPKINNSGLGLYICRNILQTFGAQIRFDKDFENGAAFIISLKKA